MSRPLPPTYFVSGASAPADIWGLAGWSVPLGVSLSALSTTGLALLCKYWKMPLLRVFADNGAFSEVDSEANVVAAIDDAAWVERMRTMHLLAATFGPPAPLGDHGPRIWVVAPDRVGDQPETLRRLALHAEAVRACRALGARIVVPIQRGKMTAAAFDGACCEALGFSDFTRGIPGNKAAMPPAELEGFLRARRPGRIHLLGVGPRGNSYGPLTSLVRRVMGDVELTCDSNAIAANVGRTNGRGGGPRGLTLWQDTFEKQPGGWPSESARAMAVRIFFGSPHMHFLTMENMRERGLAPPIPQQPYQMDLFDKVEEDENDHG